MNEVQPIIKRHCQQLSAQEANVLLGEFKSYLKIDLARDIEEASNNIQPFDFGAPPGKEGSPFDDLISEYLEK